MLTVLYRTTMKHTNTYGKKINLMKNTGTKNTSFLRRRYNFIKRVDDNLTLKVIDDRLNAIYSLFK